ncbi:MAG: hypothetical protein H7X77_07220, partial [Anaerolineae bacterium]|nr:hypothetical protein [Anaerolineae bacterium]
MIEQQITTGISLETFKNLPEDEWIEVINGELVKQTMSASYKHVNVIENLYDLL